MYGSRAEAGCLHGVRRRGVNSKILCEWKWGHSRLFDSISTHTQETFHVAEEKWSPHLSPLQLSDARRIYHTFPAEVRQDYDQLRKGLLKHYHIMPNHYGGELCPHGRNLMSRGQCVPGGTYVQYNWAEACTTMYSTCGQGDTTRLDARTSSILGAGSETCNISGGLWIDGQPPPQPTRVGGWNPNIPQTGLPGDGIHTWEVQTDQQNPEIDEQLSGEQKESALQLTEEFGDIF